MTVKHDLEMQKTKCAKMLGGKCKICGCIIHKKGMVIHHRGYIDNDVVYKNYPKNDSGRLKYYIDLEPLIKNNVKRFSYLCNPDHHSLTKICLYGDKKFNALCLERKITKSWGNLKRSK